MAAAAPGAAGAAGQAELFDSYFRRADLDQDGRITGHEAVAFFQGSNLPKPVLAQIWTYADQNRSGFLGRPEFYNALKLVTVAQSGRQLTPEIVKAALYGPAAAKIPAPQINSASTPAAQMNSLGTPRPQLNPVVPPSSPLGAVTPTASQTLGFRGPQDTSLGMNRQSFPTNHSVRPSQAAPSSASFPMQGVNQGLSATVSVAGSQPSNSIPPNLSTDWFSSRTTAASVAGVSQGSVRGVSPSTNHLGLVISGATPGLPSTPQTISSPSSSLPPKPLGQAFSSSQPTVNNSRVLATTGNGFASDTVFGGDMFSANPQLKPDASTPRLSAGNMTNSSGTPSVAAGYQNSIKTGQFDALSRSFVSQGVGQLQQTPSSLKQNLDTLQSTSTISASNVSVGPAASATSQSQLLWPKITESNIQKYTTVFVEVDKDRDGKITGDQARNLFLSWKLPREVLKQVWDLSDQDNDSMLSLREFCIALYLMERFREGRPLPAVLPNSVKFDETLLRATPQASNTFSGPTWKPNPGLSQQGIPGSRPPLPVPGVRPMHSPFPLQADVSRQTMQPRSRGPVQNHLINQPGKEEPNALNPKFQEASNASKNEPEKEILDSREKIEFYRTKMQELVLYKSRCDNRLNEITERALADKREAESLAKRYEEKYKQVGEIASKLTVEEAAFRHIQERKVELENAIVKMQQGGSADGLLQVRADRIQSDLEELMKALNERSKQCGLHVKPTTMIELPFGWQPGIQDGASEWNEDWDKFEDQGFALVKDLTVDFDADVSTAKPKSPSSWSDKASADEFSPVSSSNAPDKKGKFSGFGDQITETEPAYDQTEEDVFARSPPGSPERNVFGSPSHSTEFGTHDISPHAKGSHGDYAGGDSSEPSWSFDGNDDVDSVWGFGTTDSKEVDYDGKQNSFFSSGDFGLNPVKVNSPSAGSTFGRGRSSIFADSVPSTPLFNSGSSPTFNDGPEDRSFNTFSRFDSFSTNDGGLFNQRENFSRFDSMRSTAAYDRRQVDSFSRFDSMRSTADFDHKPGEAFARFDSMRSTADFDHKPAETFSRFDSMRSTADFDHKPGEAFSRVDSMRSTADFDHKHGETLSRFDSMRSTAEFDRSRGFPSFDDADPFGSTGPFKSSDSHSPRKGSDSWSAF